jgi:nucleotide-binding universal stress UspA family protein
VKRFKNILTVFNDVVGDDDTLNQAAALAKRNEARLTVVEVIEDAALRSSFIAEREKRLHRLTASIRQEGTTLDTVVLTGTPFLEIIRHVLRKKHDLVVMTADGGAGYRDLFFGSTSMHLMRKCPCPVWVTKPGAQNGYARILAAVGPNPDDVIESELNIKIMDLATSLAHLNKSELHIVHTWEVTGKDTDTLGSEITDAIRARILHKHELEHREPLEGLLERYNLNDLSHKIHLKRGSPDFIIPQLADTIEVDLIVMGTICRTGIPGFIIGNTAEFILRQVNCAVLTVKPEGFVTPVRL